MKRRKVIMGMEKKRGGSAWLMLKPAADKCQECALEHSPEQPHNKDSLFYQVKFEIENGRPPTWADAIAHCSKGLRKAWKEELILRGVWSEPGKGDNA